MSQIPWADINFVPGDSAVKMSNTQLQSMRLDSVESFRSNSSVQMEHQPQLNRLPSSFLNGIISPPNNNGIQKVKIEMPEGRKTQPKENVLIIPQSMINQSPQ